MAKLENPVLASICSIIVSRTTVLDVLDVLDIKKPFAGKR